MRRPEAIGEDAGENAGGIEKKRRYFRRGR